MVVRDKAHAGVALVASPASAEHVVFIDKRYLALELIVDAHAHGAHWVRSWRIHICERAVVSSEVVPELVANHSMEVSHVKVGGIAVEFPVSDAVTDHKPLEVGHPLPRRHCCVDKPVDSECELGNIDAGV